MNEFMNGVLNGFVFTILVELALVGLVCILKLIIE
jgi:hypothetical protein